MWVGGYDDWTPAEQREWDRDLEELERERAQRDLKDKQTSHVEPQTNHEDLSWFTIANDFPLFQATYTRVNGTNLYVIDLKRLFPRKPGTRNLEFEVVYPLYMGLDKIIKERTSAITSLIKVQVSSREHVGVTYECSFSPDKWSYTIMDKISEELADQLTMKQNLNRGLVMKLSLYED